MINLTNLNKEYFEDVANYWNDDIVMKTMEECGELIQALSKYEIFMKHCHPDMGVNDINKKSEILRGKLLEEIRDVYISLEAIKIFHEIDDNELNGLIEEKLKKKY